MVKVEKTPPAPKPKEAPKPAAAKPVAVKPVPVKTVVATKPIKSSKPVATTAAAPAPAPAPAKPVPAPAPTSATAKPVAVKPAAAAAPVKPAAPMPVVSQKPVVRASPKPAPTGSTAPSPMPSSKPTSAGTSIAGSAAGSPRPPPPQGPRRASGSASAAGSPKPAAALHVDPAAVKVPVAPKTRATPPPAPAQTAAAPVAKPAAARAVKVATPAAVAVAKSAPPAKTPPAKVTPAPAPAAAPGDDPDVLVKGREYVYDYVRSKWTESDCELRVLHPNRGLSQGGMRVCFEVEARQPDGSYRPMVAKMFRRNITHVVEKDYFNECQAQCLCEEFASNFNEMGFTPVKPHDDPKAAPVDRPHVEFVQCHIVRIPIAALPGPYKAKRTGFFSYRTEDTQAMMFAMEPKLKGFFTKYTNNFGAIYAENEVKVAPAEELRRRRLLRAGEAFSHFTLVETGGSMLVCDLQGVDAFLTDPQIHTEDGKGLGMGNMGQEGIDKWVEKHQCNEYCEGFALQTLQLGSLLRSDRQDSYFHALNAQLQNQNPVRPQDLVPLPKPLEDMTDDERFDYTIRLSQLLES